MGWNARVRMGVLAAAVGMGGGSVRAQEGAGVDAAGKKLMGAEGLLARGQYDMARQEFDDFLKQYPQDARATQARYERAVSAFNANDAAGAVSDLVAVTGVKEFAKRDEALALLGTAYLQQGALDKSLATLDALVKEYPQSAQVESAQVNRAQALYRLGRFGESLDAVRALLKAYPNSGYRGSALYVGAIDQRGLGDEKEAERTLREVVGSYPNSPFVYDAQLLLGESLAVQGRVEEAVAHYRKLEGEAPESKRVAVRFGLAGALMRGGRYAEAEGLFQQIAREDANGTYGAQATLQEAVAEIKAGRRDAARVALAAAEGKYPQVGASAGYWLARCDLLDGKFAEAARGLERLMGSKIPEAADAEFDLAFCELRMGHEAAAIQRLEAFRAKYPRSAHTAEALYFEASALYGTGQFAKSVEFAAAVEAYGETSVRRPAAMLRGEGLLMQNQYGPADAVFASLEAGVAGGAQGDEERVKLEFRRGQCAYFSGDFAGAETRLADVVRRGMQGDVTLADAAFLLGDAQLQQGKDQQAEATLKGYVAGAKEDSPRVQEATFKLATAQEHLKEEGAAAETLRGLMGKSADMKTPWAQRAWYEYGQLAFQRGNAGEAQEAMEKVLAAKPEGAIAVPAMYLLARIDMTAGRNREAAARLEQLETQYPHDALAQDAAFVRGMALKNEGQADLAEKQFAAYLQAYPGGKYVTEARHQRANALVAEGKKDAAGEAVRILVDLAKGSGRNDSVLYDLAWAQRGAGEEGQATKTYGELIHDFPQGGQATPARVELAQLLYAQKRYADAAALLEPAVQDGRADPHLHGVAQYWAASTAARLGDDAKAANLFDTFARGNPKDPLAAEAISEAGVCYANLGKNAEAEEHQRRVVTQFAGSEAAATAAVRLGEAQNQAEDYAGAAATFTEFLTQHPKGPLVARATFGVGWSLENRGQLEEARQRYAAVVAADNGEYGARAQFQTGETYFAEKQYAQATRELLKVDILYSAPAWAARALYEAGRAFEQLHDVGQAKQQFSLCVSKYKDSDVAPLAQKRLDALAHGSAQ